MPPRRTRTVAPKPVEDVESDVLGGVPELPPPALRAKRQSRRVQAATADPKVRLPEGKRAAEKANGALVAPVSGRYFVLQESLGLMPLMEWAAAQDEVDVNNQAQLAGLFRLLKDLVAPGEWGEFRAFTREAKCNDEDFLAFVNAAIEAIAARPTGVPAAS
jgi:hypothetical protein